MTNPTPSAQIRDFKEEFDLLYSLALTSNDLQDVQGCAKSMAEQSEKINNILNPIPSRISRFFNLQPNKPTLDSDLNAEVITKDMQDKLQKIIDYTKKLLQQPQDDIVIDSHPFIGNQIPNFEPVSPTQDPLELAAGFSNMGANCWANSILSMIVFVPSFRQIYEMVADHHAQRKDNIEKKNHGIALQKALKAYDTALIEKKPVPIDVSQNVRLALHHLFGVFSPIYTVHEDALEALHTLTTEYARVLEEKNRNLKEGEMPLSSDLYTQIETTRFCEPVGEEYEPNPYKTYSTLAQNNSLSVSNRDFEIRVDLQNTQGLQFSDLLANSFKCALSGGDKLPEYKLQNGKVKSCKLIRETNQFLHPPKEFLLNLNRFGVNQGLRVKITTPVKIDRILTLPPEATTENRPSTYELDCFIVHSGSSLNGGHYICYKKIEGKWIEANDSSVRFVKEEEIDQILHGGKGEHYTSYLHHYTISKNPNKNVIQINNNNNNNAVNLLDKIPSSPKQPELPFSKTQKNNDSILLNTLSSDAIKTFEHIIWLNDNPPPGDFFYGTNELKKNPQRLGEITLPWVLGSKGTSLWNQMILVQKRKQEILAQMLKETELQGFMNKLNSNLVSNQELIEALQSLPKEIQWDLGRLIYNAHKLIFGESYVNDHKYKYAYGEVILSQGDVKNVLLEAKILDQLLLTYQNDVKKVQSTFENEQLQAFYELLQCDHLTNNQLEGAFKRFELSDGLRGKIYEGIWIKGGRKDVFGYGEMEFQKNPRCALAVIKDLLK